LSQRAIAGWIRHIDWIPSTLDLDAYASRALRWDHAVSPSAINFAQPAICASSNKVNRDTHAKIDRAQTSCPACCVTDVA
jgi:hypothetical protein